MKKNIFITTSITIFLVQLLVFPFALNASAMETVSVSPQSAEIVITNASDLNAGIQSYQMNIFRTNSVPSDTTVRGSYYSFNTSTTDDLRDYYTNVLGLNLNVKTTDNLTGWIHLDYGVSSFKDFNSVSFDVAVWAPADTVPSDLDDFFLVKFNGVSSLDGVTVKYRLSSPDSPSAPPGGTADRFRRLAVDVFFDEPYRYDTLDVDLYVKTYIPFFDVKIRYLFGCTDLKYSKITQEEFVAGIASDVSDINEELGEANKKLGIIGNSISDIKDILSAGLSDEEAQKIMDSREELEQNSIKFETNSEYIADVDAEIKAFYQSYDDIEYDLFGDRYMDHIEEYVDPVFENDGFLSFWNGFFSHPFVVAMVIVSLTFCAVGFVMYGVR